MPIAMIVGRRPAWVQTMQFLMMTSVHCPTPRAQERSSSANAIATRKARGNCKLLFPQVKPEPWPPFQPSFLTQTPCLTLTLSEAVNNKMAV